MEPYEIRIVFLAEGNPEAINVLDSVEELVKEECETDELPPVLFMWQGVSGETMAEIRRIAEEQA